MKGYPKKVLTIGLVCVLLEYQNSAIYADTYFSEGHILLVLPPLLFLTFD